MRDGVCKGSPICAPDQGCFTGVLLAAILILIATIGCAASKYMLMHPGLKYWLQSVQNISKLKVQVPQHSVPAVNCKPSKQQDLLFCTL